MPRLRSRSKSEQNAVIALDLGGTKLAACLFADEGRPLEKRTVPLEGRGGTEVGKLVASEARRLQRTAQRRNLAVRTAGVCVPGIARARTGRVWAPNIPDWDDYPLRAELSDALADAKIKVVVESDRAASILGEAWQGAARGCRNAIFIAVGTGIGAGILVDGRLLRGAQDIAGAIGWLALARPFQRDYVQCGCFESHASGNGIAKVAAAMLARRRSYRGPLRHIANITAHDIFAAAEHGDAVAVEVLTEATEVWGMAAANLISLFNPEMIIFGGGVFGPATRLLEQIAAEARRWAQPVAFQHVKFAASQLAGDAALYGAAFVAMKRARITMS